MPAADTPLSHTQMGCDFGAGCLGRGQWLPSLPQPGRACSQSWVLVMKDRRVVLAPSCWQAPANPSSCPQGGSQCLRPAMRQAVHSRAPVRLSSSAPHCLSLHAFLQQLLTGSLLCAKDWFGV